MCGQSTLGLLYADQYRDRDWITASWFGNDLVTLLVAVPLLAIALAGAARSSARAWLLWLGVLGYAIYNYAFYLFGAALNVFFLLYVGALVVAASAMILGLAHTDAAHIAAAFPPATPTRLIGGGLVAVAIGLASIWIAMWAAFVFAGTPLPVESEAFRLVAALDLSLMVPALVCGGALLWRKSPWGYVVGGMASIQASLYLLVLSVNAAVAVRRGLAVAPGELPIWAPLAEFMTGLTLFLLSRCTQRRR
jgi:hypothetical protein